MKNILIGLGSKAQIGKDYACIKLRDFFDVERVAFADSLKNDLKFLFDKNGFDFEAVMSEPSLKSKARPLLVQYGQTMREFNENIWIERALNREFKHQLTIITDVRFPNEVAAIKKLNGFYIDIESDVPPANEVEALYSPQMLGLADFTVKNNFDSKFVSDMVTLVSKLLVTKDEKYTRN